MDDIEMRLLSRRRVYHELYEDPSPSTQPQQKTGSSLQKTGNKGQQRPKKGGAKAKNRPTTASAASRSPSKRPSATETTDEVVVNGLPAVEH